MDDETMLTPPPIAMESCFHTFTIPQICSVVGELVNIPRIAKRNRGTLLAALESFPEATRAKIRALAFTHVGTKRKAGESAVVARKRPRLATQDEEMDIEDSHDLLTGPFLQAPTEATCKSVISRFIDRTGNSAVAKDICMVCARKLFSHKLEETAVQDIPNIRNLIPTTPHHGHQLTGAYLLHKEAVLKPKTYVCSDCKKKLLLDERPPLALANGMWIGSTPFQLKILTLPERLLVALYFPAAYVVKLFPLSKSAQFWDRRTVNTGLKGNVSTYRLNTAQIAGIMSGNTMPPSPAILAATIGVTFVGATNRPLKVLPDFLRVRRQRVFEALLWLKANNVLYSAINISPEQLLLLPEDAVPDEILLNTKHSGNVDALEREQAGYVPLDVADEDPEYNARNVPGEPLDTDVLDPDTDHASYEAGVFPLQANGVIDVQGDDVPDNDILAHALSNTTRIGAQKDFFIRKSSAFVNEYARLDDAGQRSDGGPGNANHLLGAFPVLFPYGMGGLEVKRDEDVPYETHVRWALQYEDARFRTDLHFIFQVFGVIQKREVCRSASVQIKRSAFIANKVSFLKLKPKDFLAASAEETRKVPFSNPVIRTLRKQLTSLRARVPGTDESRISIRAQIWGMNLKFNPPSIWATVNLADNSDPVAQVLSGQEIDLDNFIATAGPERTARAINIASDPFAAAEFFHTTVAILLEEAFGITANRKGKMGRSPGIVGRVNGYIGTVEAQARGTLHLHILFWLDGAPTSAAMKAALQTEEFRLKVTNFVKATIRAEIKGVLPEKVLSLTKHSSVAYSRPVDPRAPNYDLRHHETEVAVARAVQVHDCLLTTCLRVRNGRLVCKRRAPWPLAVEDWVLPSGEWGPRRTYGYLNAWNPTLLQITRSNHDLKIVTNGQDTKDITFYISLYIAKKQNQSGNASALLAKSPAFQRNPKDASAGAKHINRKMIQQCANTLSRQQELSGPEVISYLMGWGDRFISHNFSPIYWDEVTGALRRLFPHLRTTNVLLRTADQLGVTAPTTATEPSYDPVVRLGIADGAFVLKDQLKEYTDRGHDLETMNYYDYHVNTYDGVPLRRKKRLDDNDGGGENGVTELLDPEQDDGRGPGRPASKRIPYLPTAGRKGCRVVRGSKLETLPHFIGTWFPRNTNVEYYAANILALLKPWRSLEELVAADGTFKTAFDVFMSTAPTRLHTITQNIDYFHECSEGARRKDNAGVQQYAGTIDLHDRVRTEIELEEINALEPPLTEADVVIARNERYETREYIYGAGAMNVAYGLGIFDDDDTSPNGPLCERASFADTVKYAEWGAKISGMTKRAELLVSNVLALPANDEAVTGTIHIQPSLPYMEGVEAIDVVPVVHTRNEAQAAAVAMLNREQRRAHDIIEQHAVRTLAGVPQEQLLMIVRGEGGTGKTVLLNAIAHTFDYLGAPELLAKTATTGVAASLVGGVTVHGWAAIPVAASADDPTWTERAAPPNVERRKRNILPAKYMNVDECSMLTKLLLAQLSQVVGQVRATAGDGDPAKPFGGMNLILFGDFHQFPPVGDPTGALYSPRNKRTQSEIGMAIYHQFTTVVTLTEQHRIEDVPWRNLLQRLRVGACTEDDIEILRSLVITNPLCEKPDFNIAPWNDAVLVTPRHAARVRWNTAALIKHCRRTGNRMYICNAEDTVGRNEEALTLAQRVAVAGMPIKKTGKLADRVELAVGMRTMVLMNIATEADLANGTRGEIIEIKLDSREPEDPAVDPETGATLLQYPPVLILFKADKCSFPRFEGLPEGVLPIVPTKMPFSINPKGKPTCRIYRRQLAMTPAYAFTDYKSQGQTIAYLFVDLAKPPTGKLTPFSAYVALSRSRGRDSIRLLRDFNVELFTTHPSEDLRTEDERLNALTIQTKLRYP